MSLFLKKFSQIHTIIALRSAAIVIQIILILFVNLGLNYELPWFPLVIVISVEVLFNFASYWYFKQAREASKLALFAQIFSDIAFLSLLLYFTGGATNAFVSLLLIPIAIAAVTLTSTMLGLIALSAIASYSILLWLLPMSVMHGNMQGHFIAMWINFLFSALVVAMVVSKMAMRINQRELAIAAYREEQLKQEKVIALGVASAQITHQLATPIATVQLLVDELADDDANNPIINDLQKELVRCTDSLQQFRTMVFNIKEQNFSHISCCELITQIEEHLHINYPEITIETMQTADESAMVCTDASVIPAVLNLVSNGIRASKANQHSAIELTSSIVNESWQLIIRDFGKGFDRGTLDKLGIQPVASEQGFGMAVFLSHASLERLGGKLLLSNHPEGGALVTLTLPLINTDKSIGNS